MLSSIMLNKRTALAFVAAMAAAKLGNLNKTDGSVQARWWVVQLSTDGRLHESVFQL
jgi:hypothetical protein